jgi:hypothetical protein
MEVISRFFKPYGSLIPALSLVVFFLSCTDTPTYHKQDSRPLNHEAWSSLLSRFVSTEGKVDYKGLQMAEKELNAYLDLLNQHPPDTSTWSENEQLAYWINAYNAFTVKLITDNYPLLSIQDLHPFPYIPFFRTVWHKQLFLINEKPISLDHIEHGILRHYFNEPRIHFAINCASVSCPPLLNTAYVPHELDIQLERAAKGFLSNPNFNRIEPEKLQLSAIFNWFQSDFTKEGSLQSFLQHYTDIPLSENATIDYLPYDWALNE